jgi:hypothetical protein
MEFFKRAPAPHDVYAIAPKGRRALPLSTPYLRCVKAAASAVTPAAAEERTGSSPGDVGSNAPLAERSSPKTDAHSNSASTATGLQYPSYPASRALPYLAGGTVRQPGRCRVGLWVQGGPVRARDVS